MQTVVLAIILVVVTYTAICILAACWMGCEHWVFSWEYNVRKRARIREAEDEKIAAYGKVYAPRASAEKVTATIVLSDIVTHHEDGFWMQYAPLVGTRV